MAIYRGAGGAGDATNDSSSEASLIRELVTQVEEDAAAAEAARAAAVVAKNAAETAEVNAELAEVNAELAETNAETAQAAAEDARDASINMAENFDVTATTLSAGSSATASYNNETFVLALGIPRGNTGATGATGAAGADGDDGRGIVSVVRTSGNGAAGTTDTYTITYTDATTSTFQVYNGANGTGTGTVTSVAMSVPTGLSVSGSPVTSSGTLAVSYASGYSIPTTAKQSEWDTAYTDRNKWDGGATGLTASTGRTSLGATTVGSNLFTLTNPSAITFPRFNADNTVSSLSASDFRTAIGAGAGTVTSVAATAGTGISVSGSPITSSGTLTITNTAPDQTVSLTAGTGIGVSGTYPNFTITNTTGSYTLPAATSTTLGGIELFSDTVQTEPALTVTAETNRTYGIQLNSAGQAVVNVPWSTGAATAKQPVSVATTANITLSGNQTIDGVLVVDDVRVLVKNQTDKTQNGIYKVATGAWSRTTDADTSVELNAAIVTVNFGTVNAGKTFINSTYSQFSPGTDDVEFVEVTTGTQTQTLTNKTISADNNTISGIASSSFVLSNGSGNIDGSAAQKAIPSGVVVGTTDTQTLTNKTLTSPTLTTATTSGKFTFGGAIDETVFAVTGTTPALSPANGTIQTWTLSANSTPTQGTWDAGEALTLMVNDSASSFTVTWTSIPVVWVGGTAPTLAPASGFTVIQLWKVGTTVYGALVGQVT